MVERLRKVRQSVDDQFNALVMNALDFLKNALDEIELHPKRTIIDFYTALELLIKARLMKEHWTLILTKPEQADSTRFLEGDFQSVTLKDARERIRKIIGDDITDDAFYCFQQIGNHRNRLVHFHNTSTNLREIATQDVLRGLHYLDTLLNGRWVRYFESYKVQIDEIVNDASDLRDFLSAKYLVLRSEIEEEISRGMFYDKCDSCEFLSAKKSPIFGRIYSSICLVCQLAKNCVLASCPGCSTQVFVAHGEKYCDCGFAIEISDLVEQFAPEIPGNMRIKRALEEYEHALKMIGQCEECAWRVREPTLHPMDEKSANWFCINCNTEFDTVHECQSCAVLFSDTDGWGIVCRACSEL